MADAKLLSTRLRRSCEPLYDALDVQKTMELVCEYPVGETVRLDRNVAFRFVPSGHILNSAQIEFWLTCGSKRRKILYTGDLGNTHIQNEYTNRLERVAKADVVIGESTYGAERRIATKTARSRDVETLEEVVRRTCLQDSGKVLIPVFANQRSQQMLTILYAIFAGDPTFQIPVLLDTPLGSRICGAYSELLTGEDAEKWAKVMTWENLIMPQSAAESCRYRAEERPMVVLASSGMLTSGRSRAWAEAVLPDSRNTIVFCGFSVENSLASILKAGEKDHIKFHGRPIPNRARIVELHSFSSHMQRDSLIDYYGSIDCRQIYLVHGETAARKDLAEAVSDRQRQNDRIVKVFVPAKGGFDEI